jgi:hypothetical protein
MCIDTTAVNKLTVKDAHPNASPDAIFEWAAGRPWRAKMDMSSGYNQFPLSPRAAETLAFTCADGLFEPIRMPFGPTNAPAYFQRQMAAIFSDIEDVRTFFDDCSVASATWEAFIATLRSAFELCRRRHIRLNLEKCVFGPSKLPLLGRLIGPTTIEIDPDRLGPLPTLRAPLSKRELRSFLGLAQYFAAFVPHMADLLSPFWPLTKADVPFEWSPELDVTFLRVRDAIVEAKPLTQFVPGQPIVIRPDYSGVAIGGTVFQRDPESGKLLPLLFYGRKLTTAETHYSTTEGECLAIVVGFNKARHFILPSTTITVVTDHSDLQFLHRSANPRVQRWRIALSEFAFDVVYAPGKTNVVADCISRLMSGTASPEHVTAIEAAPDTSATEQSLRIVGQNDIAELLRSVPCERDGDLVRLSNPAPELIDRIWGLAHSDPLAGHFGKFTTQQVVRQVVQWKGMAKDLDARTSLCPTCQKLRAEPPAPSVPLSTAAEEPFDSVFIDYLGPLPPVDGHQHVLTIVDRFSHYTVLTATADTSASTTAKIFWEKWCCSFGLPSRLTSDGGAAFAGQAFKKLLETLHTNHHISCPGHPEGHGPVERMHRVVNDVLRGQLLHRRNWPQLVPAAQFAINTAPPRLLGTSPFRVCHGFNPRLPLHQALVIRIRHPSLATTDPLQFSNAVAATTMISHTSYN